MAMIRGVGSFGAALLLAGGCVLPNPAFDQGGASEAGSGGSLSASATGSSGASASASASAGASAGATSTSGAGSASATSGSATASSTDASASTSGATSTTSGAATDGTTGDPTTGGFPNACPIGEDTILTELAVAQADTMVVKPGDGMSCVWNPMCGDLNYGAAGYVDLVSSPADGRSLFLARFDLSDFSTTLDGLGIAADSVVGLRVRLVIWENMGMPSEVWTLAVATIAPENGAWRGGDKFGTPAVGNEVSFNCRSSDGGCTPWLGDGPLGGAVDVANIKVTAQAASEGEEEEPDVLGTYHAHVVSSRISMDAVAPWLDAPSNPGFVIYLLNTKHLNDPTSLGIKPIEEVANSGTRLFVEHCVPS
ncbi:MAG: hypothetical protein H6710_06470 [Myxococcales bacterium]|nr:hypothetical protein [Myxococcales bacterium]MCB9704582.1 hypothetical protein [Myxococcales bacterium]